MTDTTNTTDNERAFWPTECHKHMVPPVAKPLRPIQDYFQSAHAVRMIDRARKELKMTHAARLAK